MMNSKKVCIIIVTVFLNALSSGFCQSLNWQKFNEECFNKAEEENKFVLLHLGANWCHWCHVMEKETYTDSSVINYLNQNYIVVHEDQDERLDLSVRYRDYGWPATIVFNKDGEEIVKRRGYISAEPFLNLLKAIVADPSPEEVGSYKYEIEEEEDLLKSVVRESFTYLDVEEGGYLQSQKFVAKEPFDMCYAYGDLQSKKWINTSLTNAVGLIDKEWGGVFQYSTHSDWEHIHYEKLLDRQGRYLEMYAKNFLMSNDSLNIFACEEIYKYTNTMLRDRRSALRFNSQDADLIPGEHSGDFYSLSSENRMKLGIPRIDSNVYTGNNARLAIGIAWYGIAYRNNELILEAEKIYAKLKKRKNEHGIYSHELDATSHHYLEDQIEVLGLLSILYQATGIISYMDEAKEMIGGLNSLFKRKDNLYVNDIGGFLKDQVVANQNYKLCLYLGELSKLGNDKTLKLEFEKLTESLISHQESFGLSDLLVPILQLKENKVPIVVNANSSTENFNASFWLGIMAQQNRYSLFKLNVSGIYPSLERDGVYVCIGNSCSPPIYDEQQLRERLN